MGFIFTPDHIKQIIAGTKTQTRRIAKPGEWLQTGLAGLYTTTPTVYTASDRRKWRVGSDYAVMPGRGKPGVWWIPGRDGWVLPEPSMSMLPELRPLRIRVLELRREPVQSISEEDAQAEGVITLLRFDIDHMDGFESHVAAYADLWDTINPRKGTRWNENPDCWAITFECEGVK